MKQLFLLFTILMLTGVSQKQGFAQNTLQFQEGSQSPPATIADVAWLEGHWRAEALGGTADEHWSAPAAGSMMGMFRLIVDDEIKFYEILTISEENGSLLLRIKHFHSNLKGWEEKDETVDFPLVRLEERTAWFSGLTMKMMDEHQLDVYVLSENRNGEKTELRFPYLRVQLNNE